MYIQVRLLNGYSTPLWYQVPADWKQTTYHGIIVQVPLRNRIVPAIVIKEEKDKLKHVTFTIKQAHNIEPFPDDQYYAPFIKQLSRYYHVDEVHFIKRIAQFVQQKQIKHRATTADEIQHNQKKTLLL